MPQRSGLEVQQDLGGVRVERPVVFISGQGDVPTSVRAMKAGAVDFLTKPFDDGQLLAAVQAAIERDDLMRRNRASDMPSSERSRPLPVASARSSSTSSRAG